MSPYDDSSRGWRLAPEEILRWLNFEVPLTRITVAVSNEPASF